MEKDTILEELKSFLGAAKGYEEAQREIKAAQEAVKAAEAYSPSRVKIFDETHKEKFIVSAIGEKPQPASKWNPFNFTKKKKEAMEKTFDEYEEKRKTAEVEYYEKYKEKRYALEQEDTADKESKISVAQSSLIMVQEKLSRTEALCKQFVLLPEKLKQPSIVEKLIIFYEDGRAESLKEAINLFYDEERKEEEARLASEHRQRLEEILSKQNDSIECAIQKAEKAFETADRALSTAQEALERAEKAYRHAKENANNNS